MVYRQERRKAHEDSNAVLSEITENPNAEKKIKPKKKEGQRR